SLTTSTITFSADRATVTILFQKPESCKNFLTLSQFVIIAAVATPTAATTATALPEMRPNPVTIIGTNFTNPPIASVRDGIITARDPTASMDFFASGDSALK